MYALRTGNTPIGVRVALITPTSCDKAAHLIKPRGVKINQKKYGRKRAKIHIYEEPKQPHGAQLGKWAALSHDVGVIRDTLIGVRPFLM